MVELNYIKDFSVLVYVDAEGEFGPPSRVTLREQVHAFPEQGLLANTLYIFRGVLLTERNPVNDAVDNSSLAGSPPLPRPPKQNTCQDLVFFSR